MSTLAVHTTPFTLSDTPSSSSPPPVLKKAIEEAVVSLEKKGDAFLEEGDRRAYIRSVHNIARGILQGLSGSLQSTSKKDIQKTIELAIQELNASARRLYEDRRNHLQLRAATSDELVYTDKRISELSTGPSLSFSVNKNSNSSWTEPYQITAETPLEDTSDISEAMSQRWEVTEEEVLPISDQLTRSSTSDSSLKIAAKICLGERTRCWQIKDKEQRADCMNRAASLCQPVLDGLRKTQEQDMSENLFYNQMGKGRDKPASSSTKDGRWTKGMSSVDILLKLVNDAAKPVKTVEEAVGYIVSEGVKKGCSTSAGTLICKTVVKGLNTMGETVSALVPNSVKDGVDKIREVAALTLDHVGISSEKATETAHSIFSLGTVAFPVIKASKVTKVDTSGVLSKGLSEEITLKLRVQEPVVTTTIEKPVVIPSHSVALRREKLLVEQWRNESTLSKLPSRFPKHLNDFLTGGEGYEVHHFTASGVGMNEKGTMKGSLLFRLIENDWVRTHYDMKGNLSHTPGGNSIVVLIKYDLASNVVRKSTGTRLIDYRGTHTYWPKRLDAILDEVIGLANKEGCEIAHVLWDPTRMAVGGRLNDRAATILSRGPFSAGYGQPPLWRAEIEIK